MEKVKRASDDLLLTMEQELRLFGDLIGFAREKITHLTHADAESLDEVLRKEEEAVDILREKEKEQRKNAKALAVALCMPEKDLTLKKLTEQLDDPEYSKRLMSTGDEMNRAMRELSRHNTKVKGLLRHQIRYTNFMINLMYGSPSGADFYNIQGNREEKVSLKNRFDYQA